MGAGLVIMTPSAAKPPDIEVRDVALTATLPDLLAPFADQLNTASANLTQLANNFLLAPGVALQQFFANQAGFLQDVLTDTSNITEVALKTHANLDAVLTGIGLINADPATLTTVLHHTLSATDNEGPITLGHDFLFQEFLSQLPPEQAATFGPLLDLSASPLSGIIIGSLGPALSPWVALLNSLTDGDSPIDTLANVVGAVFNGATIDLAGLIPTIEQSGLLPAGSAVSHLDAALGGLLSPGSVQPIYQVVGADGEVVASVPAVGGSIFNSLGITVEGAQTVAVASMPVGPLGAWQGLGQTIGALSVRAGTARDRWLSLRPESGSISPSCPVTSLMSGR